MSFSYKLSVFYCRSCVLQMLGRHTNNEDVWACAKRDWCRGGWRSWCWTSASV